MKTLTTKVVKINGQFDVYSDENAKRFQNYSDLAAELGRDWNEMSKRARANFRRRNADKVKEIPTHVECYEITATIPVIFGEYQLKRAAINHLIHPATGTIFLECKNGRTGYSTNNFQLNKVI